MVSTFANLGSLDFSILISFKVVFNPTLFLMASINNISFNFPSFPLLTQPENIEESMFCDELHMPERCFDKNICPCVHRLKIKLNSIVELVIVDESPSKWLKKKISRKRS